MIKRTLTTTSNENKQNKYNKNNNNNKRKKLIVIIPAYNEEQTIGQVIKEIPRQINHHKVQIIVVDDGSKDNTIKVAEQAGADYIFKNTINRGLGKTFKKGIEEALRLKADIIVNIDADRQFNPKDIAKLIIPILRKDADMVTASRFLNPELTRNMPLMKKWGNKRFTKLVSRITGQRFTDTQCGFRAYSREAALKLNVNGGFTYTQESFIDLIEKGMRIKEIPLEVRYFKKRKSAISGKLLRYGFKSLGIIAKTTRDTQPLTFFGLPALIIFSLGFLGGLYSFFYWLTHLVTAPIRTLFNVSVFFMIAGIALAILGLLADMIKTLKRNQEEILYRIKKQEYNGIE